MANFCLIPSEVDKFKSKLIDGSIDPERLSNMTSEERHNFFKDITGEANAKGVNALFESKLLLKNQQAGMVTWAKKVSGISEPARRDLISKIQRMDHVLNPEEEKMFLKDLASTKLGVDVTSEEAKAISDLSRKVTETETGVKPDSPIGSPDRMAHGYAMHDLNDYVSNLKHDAQHVGVKDFFTHPSNLKSVPSRVAGTAKAVKASMDDSALFNQGLKPAFTHPKIWAKNSLQSFVDLAREFGGKNVLREVDANIISRPNYELYKGMKLALEVMEEDFPTALPEKVPLLGRVYKATEVAFTAFQRRNRADIADAYINVAKKAGVNLKDKKELESIGKLVGSLTARGYLGAAEKVAGPVNNVFFSPRRIKANIDTLTAHQLQKDVTPFVRKQAAKNLLKIVGGVATVLATAEVFRPGSVERDPRSTDFGKIKVGDTRFDVTGGMGSITTLAMRLIPTPGPNGIGEYTKSSNTKSLTKLSSGKYGSQTGMDVFNSFIENKASPAASVIVDLLKGQDHNFHKPTAAGELNNLLTPLSITTYFEAKGDPHGANALLTTLIDGLGIAANTYGKSVKDWSQNPSAGQAAFLKSVGTDKFKAANQDYNNRVSSATSQLTSNLVFKSLPDAQKSAVLSAAKAKIEAQVFKDNGFKYKKALPDRAAKATQKSLLQSVR